LSVIVDCGGELARTRRLGLARFERAVRAVIVTRGGQKPTLRIVRNLVTALSDPAGVIAHRPGALERIRLILEDWQHAHTRLADTAARMVAVLDELQLTGLGCSIKGLAPSAPPRSWPRPATCTDSPPPARWSNTPAWHPGRSPPAHTPAAPNSPGKADRHCGWPPGARSGTPCTNPAYAARYRHLSTREHNRRKPTQAQTVITAAILRPLHAIITTGQRWDPLLATHGTRTLHPTTIAA
jgi:transposase